MGKKRSLLLDALSQVFIKPRGILKMSQVWLPLSLILAAGTGMDPRREFYLSLYLLFAVLSKGLASILINDLTDRKIDRRAGKERWITALPSPGGILIPIFLLASGFLALIRAGGDLPVLGSYTATVILGILYSVKPVRFKERGVWGMVAYSLSAAILHALVPWTLFCPAFWLLPLLFSAVIGEKLVQILFHQIVDFDSDSEGKIKSFAVISGRRQAARTLRTILNFALAADAALLIYIFVETEGHPLFLWLIGLACLLGVTASGIYVRIISKKLNTSTELTDLLPWPYLGLSYVLFYLLPPLLLFRLALQEPRMGVLAVLCTLSLIGVSINYLFYHPKK
jgi:hypothetical protein